MASPLFSLIFSSGHLITLITLVKQDYFEKKLIFTCEKQHTSAFCYKTELYVVNFAAFNGTVKGDFFLTLKKKKDTDF